MKKKLPPLTPPDPKQCQAEKKEGAWPDAEHFMVIGPAHMARCQNKPTVIIKEVKPAADGRRGSMSLCPDCLKTFLKQNGTTFAVIAPIRK